MGDQSHTPDEQVKDFIGETIDVKLKNGLTVSVTTPTNRFWLEFLIPKIRLIQWQGIDDNMAKQLKKELEKGEITEETITKMPLPLADFFAEFLIYHTKQNKEYVLDKMFFEDDLAIINAWLKVTDIKRIMDFFGEISKQVPVLGIIMGIIKAKEDTKKAKVK
jgi:hypothetical protein